MLLISLFTFLFGAAAYPAELPAPVLSLLRSGRFIGTPAEFRIIALSHIADACAARASSDRLAARTCVARTLELARSIRPKALDLARPDTSHGLWLTHLALVLGAGDATGPCLDAALHSRLATALASRSLAEPLAHVPSYPGTRARWPADQSATLAALSRYDRTHGTHLTSEPLRRYEAVMDTHLGKDGLPVSEVVGATPTSWLPRGCALSFTVRYLAEADPQRALALWNRYRQQFLVEQFLITGFREWPLGTDRPADADSGPIVHGVGAAASAFGIAAARAMRVERLAASLESTADLVERAGGTLSSQIVQAASSTLAAAIRAQAKLQPPLLPNIP